MLTTILRGVYVCVCVCVCVYTKISHSYSRCRIKASLGLVGESGTGAVDADHTGVGQELRRQPHVLASSETCAATFPESTGCSGHATCYHDMA